MKKKILILFVIMILSSVGVYVSAAVVDPCLGLPASINWPTGILGRCPDAIGYDSCCYDGNTCGIMVGGTCVSDRDVFDNTSYPAVVQYFNSNSLNNGRCATNGPAWGCPSCNLPAAGYSSEIINCYDETDNPSLAGGYCTSIGQIATAALDNVDIESPAPLNDLCMSFRGSSPPTICWGQNNGYCTTALCGNCALPPPGYTGPNCNQEKCRASYECIYFDSSNNWALCDPAEGEINITSPVTVTLATCSDGIRNQGETGVDGGGPCCGDTECKGGETAGTCAADCGTCFDLIQNQGETGVDCGGPCPACGTCIDDIQNGDETDVDCGGTICPACIEGQICSINSDCDTNNCEEDGFGNKVCVSGMPACTILLHTWGSPDELEITEIPAGILGMVVFAGDSVCADATIDITVNGLSTGVLVENGLTFEAVATDSGTVYASLVMFETSGISLDYTATLHHPDLSTEVINSASSLSVTGACSVADPNACDESTLDPSDQAMHGGVPDFPDVDCDGIADCVDTWLYGDETNDNPYGSCSTPWNCDQAPWSECYQSAQGLGQTRFVRDINVYGAPGCDPQGQLCPPPPSFKACIAEEPFPVFTWLNMLFVTMMLISFYAIKIRKL
jgi:hypothetical protein